jgi:hypothetical protein
VNKITIKGLEYMRDSLIKNSSLKEIDLNGIITYKTLDNAFLDVGCTTINEILKNSKIERLYLGGTTHF